MPKPKLEKEINVPEDLIKELLTESEWRMVKQRLEIITLLQKGLSIRQIAKRIKVGTDTVVRISKKLQSSPILKKSFSKPQTVPTTWVIGQKDF